jgi:hypothetical protein
MKLKLGNIRYGFRTEGKYCGLIFVTSPEREGTVRFASQVDGRVYETTTGWAIEGDSVFGNPSRESDITLIGDFSDAGKAECYKGIWRVPDARRK